MFKKVVFLDLLKSLLVSGGLAVLVWMVFTSTDTFGMAVPIISIAVAMLSLNIFKYFEDQKIPGPYDKPRDLGASITLGCIGFELLKLYGTVTIEAAILAIIVGAWVFYELLKNDEQKNLKKVTTS